MRVSRGPFRTRAVAAAAAALLAVSVTVSVTGAGQARAEAAARPASGGQAAPGGQPAPGGRAHGGPAARDRRQGRDGRRPIRVGSVTIPPCRASRLAWCTRIRVPYDYRNPAAGTIKLGFRWYPATTGRATGTILAVQGGPGYPTTDYAAEYRATFLPLLGRRNLLLVNLRGTGNSSAFTCKALQDWTVADGTAAYAADTGRCGRQLNHTRKLAGGGGYVQASDLYTTANAARDVARLLRRLHTGQVDLYGDSYGTFFGQVFTARYASMLRSVTLDAAYPVSEKDPWYPHTIITARRAFRVACLRSVACHAAAPGSSWARIVRLAAYLRAHPVTGRTRDAYGQVITQRVGIGELIELVNNAGTDNIVYRELDPAARALLNGHDAVPLLRLAATDLYTGNSGPVRQFNDGLYQATTCLDYPQPFSYRSSPARRQAEYDAAAAALPRRTFAPFTVREWITEPDEEFDACLHWPAPAHRDPPITTPPPYAPATLPVLVLSGDLDSLTTPFEGRRTARDMGPSARWILIRNDTHINALDDTFGCAEGLVRAFITAPSRLRQLNASCARKTPEVRVVGNFPRRLAGLTPAAATAGNRAGRTARRLAAAGAEATGDAEWRWYYGDGVDGWGLRGGTYHYAGPARAIRITFRKVRWTADTAVSGHATWNQDSGRMTAWLTVTGPGGHSARIQLSYRDYTHHPAAAISGRYRGRRIRASVPAP
jgi:pimeloyl-ACP methyl ester carboxylesterase